MTDLAIAGVDLYHLVSCFFIYSFLGWLWETCFVSAKSGKLVNRGFVNGPFCTIYGFGAVSVYLILKPIEDRLVLLFFGGILVATLLEYVTAVLMEGIFHTSWWDYSRKKFNFQGRICLADSLGWGVFTVILFRVLHPFVSKFVDLYPVMMGEIAIGLISAVYVVDFAFSAAAAFHLSEKLASMEGELERIRQELGERLSGLAEAASLGQIKGRLEEMLEDVTIFKGLGERGLELREQLLREFQERKKALTTRLGHNVRRFMRAYPNLNKAHLRLSNLRRERKKK